MHQAFDQAERIGERAGVALVAARFVEQHCLLININTPPGQGLQQDMFQHVHLVLLVVKDRAEENPEVVCGT